MLCRGKGIYTMVETTPVARRTVPNAATDSKIQAVLRGAPLHPPPFNALDSSASSTAEVATELMAVSHKLDLAILCAGNTISTANLLEFPENVDGDSLRNGSVGRHRTAEDPFQLVSFAIDGELRPEDEVSIPSKAIPSKTRIRGLEFSPSGQSLLIWGKSYVAVARVPQSAKLRGGAGGRTPSRGTTTPSKATASAVSRDSPSRHDQSGDWREDDTPGRWQWTLLDMSGHAVDTMKQRVVHATWHPAGQECVTLLTVSRGDGLEEAAGGYVMLHVPGREKPEQTVPIASGSSKSQPVAIAHSCGEGWRRFTVWIARRDGSVAALCPLVPDNAKVDREELMELRSVTQDKLVAARHEQSTGGGMGRSQAALEEEITYLEQQKAWLSEAFGSEFGGKNAQQSLQHDNTVEPPPPGNSTALAVRGRHSSSGEGMSAISRYPVLQDDIVFRRGTTSSIAGSGTAASANADAIRGGAEDTMEEKAGGVCALTVLEGHDNDGDVQAAVCAPGLIVLAVGYGGGLLDMALLLNDVAPRWSQHPGTRVSCPCEERASLLESVDLGERSADSSAKRKQGMALAMGFSAWTLFVATPCRLTSISVNWAASIDKMMACARRRAAMARPGIVDSSSSGRLDGDLKAALIERPESSVAELLYVPPSADAKICALIPFEKVEVGHLILARLSSGALELVNQSVVTAQAVEVASAAKRARSRGTPGRGDMLPLFEVTLEKAEAELEQRRCVGKFLGSHVGGLRLSQLDEGGVSLFKEQAKSLDRGIGVWENLHEKTTTRLQALREVYELQAELVAGVSKDVSRFRKDQEVVEDALEESREQTDICRERSAIILNVVQEMRSTVSAAERAYMAEIKDMENYADRVQVKIEPAAKQIEELVQAEREAEEFLVREAEGVSGGGGRGAGTGLTETEIKYVWNMLQADRKRISDLNKRLEVARKRLADFGVHLDD